jgi:hypothetical protein
MGMIGLGQLGASKHPAPENLVACCGVGWDRARSGDHLRESSDHADR